MDNYDQQKKGKRGNFELIDLDEFEEREKKFASRINDIRNHAGYMDETIRQYELMKHQRLLEGYWQRYLRCDGLPRPDSPPQIRMFIERQRHFQKFDDDNTIDWQLTVNERCLLTQDISRIDVTRKTTRSRKCPDIGAQTNGFINEYLKALKDIDLFLENDIELCRIDLSKAYEIITLRLELEQEIFDTLNRLTYSVIANDSAFMSTSNGIFETYSYKGNVFCLDIWALTNAPMRFNEFDLPIMLADLNVSQVNIQVPLSVLSAGLTLECLHTYFDYFSGKAKSFEHIVTVPTDHLNAGIPDMEKCMINEWQWQKRIQEERRQSLLWHYERYVDAQRVYEETLKAKLRVQSENANVPKPPKLPQFLPENMFPEITNLFLNQEDKQWREFLDEYFHPNLFQLNSFEINLRKYSILGGIYSLYFVHRPPHYNINNFNSTIHDRQRKLHVYDDIVADTKVFYSESSNDDDQGKDATSHHGPSSQPDVRFHNEKLRARLTVAGAIDTSQYKTDFDEMPYFFVTFKLERNLCLWGQPIVCQFVEKELEVPLSRQTLHVDILGQFRDRVGTNSNNDNSDIEDEPAIYGNNSVDISRPSAGNDLQKHRSLHANFKTVNAFRTKFSSLLRNFDMPSFSLPNACIEDFSLNGPLTIKQQRSLVNHCVTRLAPSFTFPMETRDEIERVSDTKTKKSRMLLRKREEQEVDEPVGKTLFTYKGQKRNPEYVFPVFDSVQNVDYDHVESTDTNEEPQTFHEFMHILDDIKKKYLSNYHKILNQSEIEPHPIAAYPKRKPSSTTSSFLKFDRKSSFSKRIASKAKIVIPVDKQYSENDERSFEVDLNNIDNLYSQHETIGESPTKITKIKCWTTEFIKNTVFNREQLTVTVQTDRLGIFGFAYNRYEHYPFRTWELYSNPEQEGEVIFLLDTQHVRLVLYISNKGFRGFVTDLKKEFVLKPVKYVNIEEPIDDLNELKKHLIDKNVCVFSENDASFYIKGLFCQKHLATEHHTYDAMAMHCMLLKFQHSLWNRMASRRNIVIDMKGRRDDTPLTVRITPEQTTFVNIKELCSNDIETFNLQYIPTWRNISNYTDVNNAICSVYSNAFDVRNKDPALVSNLRNLLHVIKPLSFS